MQRGRFESVPEISLPPCMIKSVLGDFPDCFGSLRNSSVCFGCFDIGSNHRNKPKKNIFGFTKRTETNAKQILFRFVSVRTEIIFFSFRGHPSLMSPVAHNIFFLLVKDDFCL
jgi:hypothetical protein